MLAVDLSEFRRIFAGNFIDLVVSELLWRNARRVAGFAEKAVQAGRRYAPEQEQFVIGISDSMPGVFGNENDCAFLKMVVNVVQHENSATCQNVEGFVHLKVPVDWNAGTGLHLLCA